MSITANGSTIPRLSLDVVLFVLLSDGSYAARYTLGQLAAERKGKAKEDFVSGLVGKILIVDSRIGGLIDGVLASKGGRGFPTADTDKGWSEDAGFRVRLDASSTRSLKGLEAGMTSTLRQKSFLNASCVRSASGGDER